MTEILRDSIWQFIGVIAALIAIIISVILFLIQRKKKQLSYEIRSVNPVVTIDDKFSNDLKILYKGSNVSNLFLIILKIVNNGNASIQSGDFNKHLTISFKNSKTKILTVETLSKTPPDLHLQYNFNEKEVEIEPSLLNASDNYVLRMLVDNYNNDISISARIIGVKRIREIKKRLTPNLWSGMLFGFVLSVGIILIISDLLAIGIFTTSIAIIIALLTWRHLFRKD